MRFTAKQLEDINKAWARANKLHAKAELVLDDETRLIEHRRIRHGYLEAKKQAITGFKPTKQERQRVSRKKRELYAA